MLGVFFKGDKHKMPRLKIFSASGKLIYKLTVADLHDARIRAHELGCSEVIS